VVVDFHHALGRPAIEGTNIITKRCYWQIVRLVIGHWEEIKELGRRAKKPFGYVIEIPRNKILSL